MSNVKAQIQVLARNFVDQVVEALRGASLRDLLGSSSGAEGHVGTGRRSRRAEGGGGQPDPLGAAHSPAHAPTHKTSGRLRRRSAGEITAAVDKIATLLKKHKSGLRAEEIRVNLGMISKEMPRILKEGLATKKLTSKGNKRATTYFAK